MNLLDVVVGVVALAALVAGWRTGLLARAAALAGMAVGVVAVARLLPAALRALGQPDPAARLAVVAVLLGIGAMVGNLLGLSLGAWLRSALPFGPLRALDRLGGAVAGLVSVAVVAWLLLPAFGEVAGPPARLARSSVVARALHDHAPHPPDPLEAVRRVVGDRWFPEVFAGLGPSPVAGPVPVASGLDPATVERVAASTVRVEGRGCGRLQEGSGFVVEPGLVVTNAHVVAGMDDPDVVFDAGGRQASEVVAFDPDRDLALLALEGGGARPVPVAPADAGDVGAVFGHPAGGALRLAPFRVEQEIRAVGRDLYDEHDTAREVLVLAADLARGDSGGALVDAGGVVVGVAFAVAPDRPGVAYALTVDELAALLDAPRAVVSTGPCLAA